MLHKCIKNWGRFKVGEIYEDYEVKRTPTDLRGSIFAMYVDTKNIVQSIPHVEPIIVKGVEITPTDELADIGWQNSSEIKDEVIFSDPDEEKPKRWKKFKEL